MKTARSILLFSLALEALAFTAAGQDRLKIRPELAGYEETSRYSDVVAFLSGLEKQSDVLRLEYFGRTSEGRALPLLICANPPVSRPREASQSGKPVIFVMANIHAGEVEGKEAVQLLARRIAAGDLRPLLGRLIILLAPIYNADGNERISMDNRPAQNGPIGGVGRRENAEGLDLNRDYMKLEAPESRALVRLFNRWDPHLTMDLHTSDGSYHGYHLTYSPPLNPDAHARLIAYERERMLPAITKVMLSRHGFRTYFYGNFSLKEQLDREFAGSRPGADGTGAPQGTRIWRTFDHHPRFGNNYVGLRNRLALLSEAYSYLDFRGRIAVTEAFVEETLKYSAAHAGEILRLIRRLDEDTVKRPGSGKRTELGIAFQVQPFPKPVDILVGQVEKEKNPRTGREMTAVIPDRFAAQRMLNYGLFGVTRSVALPGAYIFRADPALKPAVEILLAHGISVEELTEPVTLEVESYVVDRVSRAQRAYQGHRETRVDVRALRATLDFPEGSMLVRMAQPLANLAFYLLEPESDDGLVTWNLLDGLLGAGQEYPIHRILKNPELPSRLVE